MIWPQLAIAMPVASVGMDTGCGMDYLTWMLSMQCGGRVVYLELCYVFLLSDGVDMIGLLNAADC